MSSIEQTRPREAQVPEVGSFDGGRQVERWQTLVCVESPRGVFRCDTVRISPIGQLSFL